VKTDRTTSLPACPKKTAGPSAWRISAPAPVPAPAAYARHEGEGRHQDRTQAACARPPPASHRSSPRSSRPVYANSLDDQNGVLGANPDQHRRPDRVRMLLSIARKSTPLTAANRAHGTIKMTRGQTAPLRIGRRSREKPNTTDAERHHRRVAAAFSCNAISVHSKPKPAGSWRRASLHGGDRLAVDEARQRRALHFRGPKSCSAVRDRAGDIAKVQPSRAAPCRRRRADAQILDIRSESGMDCQPVPVTDRSSKRH